MLRMIFGLVLASQIVSASPFYVEVPESLESRLKSFEPSAAVYLRDRDLFLVASDDTTKKNDPWLFLINRQGQVHPAPVVISGLQAITDIESISQDEQGRLYILGSQGLNKKGLDIKERNFFVRAEMSGQQVRAINKVELRPILIKALMQSQNKDLAALKPSLVAKLDIESHFLERGELYVGLKDPQVRQGIGMILNLGSVEKLFQTQQIEKLQPVLMLNFNQNGRSDDVISEMLVVGGQLFIATTSETGAGKLWIYLPQTRSLRLVRQYDSLRPEGLAFDSVRSELAVFFDQGEDQAMMTVEKIQTRRR